ncbi:retrovirus-related pol polyprotein from transposon TNT 1-94 [Tanacetum coccineum]|uniref:Retrovirus-related pol polyprotein from transposon TNT 1-94 n=1 Tax=Tanacetum coccineum TaxID=301880 RepID=A0ABQ5FMP7_9ASTR
MGSTNKKYSRIFLSWLRYATSVLDTPYLFSRYGILTNMEYWFFGYVDQSIIYGVSADVDTTYSSKVSSVDTIFDGVERCKQTIAKRTYLGHIDPFIQNTIEGNFCPQIQKINADLEKLHLCLKEEMVDDFRYFNSLEHEADSLKSQLETQRTQFLNKIDRLSRKYYYADHMNAILGVYTKLDEFTDLQCDYLDQDLKAQLRDKNIAISELKKLIEKMKGKSVETKFEKSSVIRQRMLLKVKDNQFQLIEIILFIIDSRCSKHMMGNLKLLSNFVEKFLGTVKFGNNQIALILGYGDLVQGNFTIKRVYYVKGLNHNLFSVGQFCDADLEVTFRKSTCYIRDLKGNDLFTGSRGTDLYSITLQDTYTPNPIYLMAKASSSQAWLWHRRLSHLNFDSINLLSKNDIVIGLPKLKFVKDRLCSSCELGKAKRKSFKTKTTPSSKRQLKILHMDLCGPMRVESFNVASDHVSSGLVPQCSTTALEQVSLSPGPQSQENVPQAA